MISPKPATEAIIQQQEGLKQSLPFADDRDFDDAKRGLLGSLDPNTVTNENGEVVWDNEAYNFLTGGSPNEANPSLWRQSKLTATAGLYRVHPQIYQVRGLDISNVTLVEGDEGLIIIDPLTSKETAQAAFNLYKQYRSERPVKAVIYTHSHADHFGGVKGFIAQEAVDSGAVSVLAPEGFLEHAVSENVFTGTSMSRRAAYMYGAALSRGPRGQIGSGLGQTVSTGTVTLIAPTDIITRTKEERIIDGVKIVFQMAPDTEAPAEMLFYFPQFKALCAADDTTHTFHNLLTLRGAVVRNPHGWARSLTETIDLFGNETEILFASHQWPTWGNDRILKFLTSQRDLYAYVHDQTLRLLNKGYTGMEIAELMTLPPELENSWSARGYYGSISHNVKAIYQRYVGWFDGNPSHLWEHDPVNRAKRYVNLAGGVEQMVARAAEAFDVGDFRWAAELLNHAVFAEPDDLRARDLLADTYEQLGYGSENSTWRNFYMSGATELRSGNFGTPTATASADVIAQLTPEMLFDSIAIQVDGPRAWDQSLTIDVVLRDRADQSGRPGDPDKYRLRLSHGALIYTAAPQPTAPDATITATTRTLPALVLYGLDPELLEKEGIVVDDPSNVLGTLAGLLDPGDPNFNIVTP